MNASSASFAAADGLCNLAVAHLVAVLARRPHHTLAAANQAVWLCSLPLQERMGEPWAKWTVSSNRFAPLAAYMKRTIRDVRRKARLMGLCTAPAAVAAAPAVPTATAASAAGDAAARAAAAGAAAPDASQAAAADAATATGAAASTLSLPSIVDGHAALSLPQVNKALGLSCAVSCAAQWNGTATLVCPCRDICAEVWRNLTSRPPGHPSFSIPACSCRR